MSAITLFEEKQVRRAWNQAEEKWYFSIDDIVELLTSTTNVKDYIKKLRKRDPALDSYWVTNCPLVAMPGADGKIRPIRAAHTEALLRLIQSIPSPKAEPFKLWLAKVGYERLEEIENPELAAKRMRQIYEQKGYSEEWIEKRLRGIAVRDELTDEWKKRGVKEQKEFAILTAKISKATFGMTPSEYKAFKALANPKENLRDHMTDLELISPSPAICRSKSPCHVFFQLGFRVVPLNPQLDDPFLKLPPGQTGHLRSLPERDASLTVVMHRQVRLNPRRRRILTTKRGGEIVRDGQSNFHGQIQPSTGRLCNQEKAQNRNTGSLLPNWH